MLWSDAWVLLATIYAGQGKPAPLPAVIAAADYIQHAVVEFEEMEGALARLTDAGYLGFFDGCVEPKEGVLAYYRSVTKPRRKVLDEQNDIAIFIGAEPWKPGVIPKDASNGVAFPGLTREAFEKAVVSYVGRHARSRS
jgi:uncharacterized protein (UPF0264 family)